ncbi:hypothetical protein BU52_27925 [Streptomyces toyocaensis]|uniref:Uncharacterized protein n=1 Tax=Streptomyces toyocaensis TaxID=55952 RepID=A0A081XK75_STRTO|nr:hypothetical protein [Streptomyces toyocaensis]KES03948.1 hypothetical protein BU52_27925 [Streptomyces toyocaensis]
MTSPSFQRTLTLPASLCEQAVQHLEQAARRTVDGAGIPLKAFRAAADSDYTLPVTVVEQAAGCLLVLATETAQSVRPSVLRATIAVALCLRDAVEAVHQPALTTRFW